MDTLELLVAYLELEDARVQNAWRQPAQYMLHSVLDRGCARMVAYSNALNAVGAEYYWGEYYCD